MTTDNEIIKRELDKLLFDYEPTEPMPAEQRAEAMARNLVQYAARSRKLRLNIGNLVSRALRDLISDNHYKQIKGMLGGCPAGGCGPCPFASPTGNCLLGEFENTTMLKTGKRFAETLELLDKISVKVLEGT